jgi:hypothetical protein
MKTNATRLLDTLGIRAMSHAVSKRLNEHNLETIP